MKINQEIYYHANSNKKLSVGDVLIFDCNTKNKMYNAIYNSSFLLYGKDANEIMNDKRRSKDVNFSRDELNLIFETVNNSAFVMRELALEEVRKNLFSKYPSRLSCLYVTNEKKEAHFWSSILKRNGKECMQILTLELTGDIYSFDGKFLMRKNCSYQEHLDNALKYWNSDGGEEYLFLGSAKVVEIEEL